MSKVLREFTWQILNEESFKKPLIKQNSALLRDGFKRLKNFVGESDQTLEKVYLRLGIQENLIRLSSSTDSIIYDIVDTYELGNRLKKYNGNWDLTWNSIKDELSFCGDEYGAAANNTITSLRECFIALQKLIEPLGTCFDIEFDYFFKNEKGELLFIPRNEP